MFAAVWAQFNPSCSCFSGFREAKKKFNKKISLIVAEPDCLERTHMGVSVSVRDTFLCQWLWHSLSPHVKLDCDIPAGRATTETKKSDSRPPTPQRSPSTHPPSQTPFFCCHHPLNFHNHPYVPSLLPPSPPRPRTWRSSHSRMLLFGVAVTASTVLRPRASEPRPTRFLSHFCICCRRDTGSCF